MAPTRTTTTQAPEKVKMAFIFPGSITDTAWNEAGYRGMEAFQGKHPEVEIAWVQGVYDPAQIESQIRSHIQQGYKLIVGLGFQFGEPMAKLAKEYKDVYFLAVAGSPDYIGPQVSVAAVRTDQSCFVAGYLAIKLSRTKNVVFVGGMAVAELTYCEAGMTWSISITLQDPLQKMGHPEMVYFMLMLPYIVIIVALVIMSRGARPPKYIGVPYTRE